MHVASMRERRGANRFSWGSLRERYHLEDKGVNGKQTLKRNLNSLGGCGLD